MRPEDYEYEIMNPTAVKRHSLTDFVGYNKLSTILPTGDDGESSNSLMIMVSVSDNLGGITNVT